MSGVTGSSPRLRGIGPPDLLQRCQQLGGVELAQSYTGGYRASLTVGKRYDCQLRVWGEGERIEDALRDVLRRVEPMLERLGRDLA